VYRPFRDYHFDAVCRKDLERGCAGRNRECMCVNSQKQRAVGPLFLSIEADRLSYRKYVSLIERAVEGRPRCPEVPNTTLWAGTDGSGTPEKYAVTSMGTSTSIPLCRVFLHEGFVVIAMAPSVRFQSVQLRPDAGR